ncbi:MAG: hypothetical protein HY070_01755 [Chloroflexi bacterium]|nr:hypothetical protein [Chloroflexota bacterium]
MREINIALVFFAAGLIACGKSAETLTTQTAIEPPLTRTPTPTKTATPTLLPPPSNVTFLFGEEVLPAEREIVQNGIAIASQYFGDAGPLTVDVDTNRSVLQNRYPNLPTDFSAGSVGGRGPGVIAILASSSDWQNMASIRKLSVLSHEYFHVLQNRLEKDARFKPRNAGIPPDGPIWLREGSAEYYGFRSVASYGLVEFASARLERIARSKGINNTLSELETSQSALVFTLGFLAAEFLEVKSGSQSLLKYYETIGTGVEWQVAFQNVFGVSIAAFYRQFEDYRRNGYVLTPSATTTPKQ